MEPTAIAKQVMEPTGIAKQVIDLQKTAFDNAFNAMVMLQDQTEKMTSSLLGQVPGLPEEAKKAINEWVKAYKKGRDDFKMFVDENYKKVEAFLTGSK